MIVSKVWSVLRKVFKTANKDGLEFDCLDTVKYDSSCRKVQLPLMARKFEFVSVS